MILGIDPGGSKPHAIAVYEDGLLLQTFKSSSMIELYGVIEQCKKVFIETQYFGGNANTLIMLSQKTGMLMCLCELHCIEYEMIPPITWESWHNLPKKPRKSKKDPERVIPTPYRWKIQHAQDIINKAKELTGVVIEDEDIGAAVLIGWYGLHSAEGLA